MQKADHETAKKPEPSIAVHAGQTSDREPCSDCPWRIANHGRRHPGGFFRKDNLRRLWNQIRKGGGMQTCHPTDPSHPDHRKYGGAKEGSDALECIGSIVLVTREIVHAARLGKSQTTVDVAGAELYLKESRTRKGLTRSGLLWGCGAASNTITRGCRNANARTEQANRGLGRDRPAGRAETTTPVAASVIIGPAATPKTSDQLVDLTAAFLQVLDPARKLDRIDGPEIHQVQLVGKRGGILREIGKDAVRLMVRLQSGRLVVRPINRFAGIDILGPGTATADRRRLSGRNWRQGALAGCATAGRLGETRRTIGRSRWSISITLPLLADLRHQRGTAADVVGNELGRRSSAPIERESDGTTGLGTAQPASVGGIGSELEPQGILRRPLTNVGFYMRSTGEQARGHAVKAIREVQLAATAENGDGRNSRPSLNKSA